MRERLSRKPVESIEKSNTPVTSSRDEVREVLAVPHALDEFDFEDTIRSCTAVMLLRVNEDGEIGYVEPFHPESNPNNKDSVYNIYDENFDFSNPNELFAFYQGGKWNFIGQRVNRLSASKKDLFKLRRTYMHIQKERKNKIIH